jgi:hypothetical protein
MRSGKWRGMPLAVAVAITLGLGLGLASSARADGFLCPHVLPGVVPAYDFTTGQQYQALPIPYGHYAKDYVAEAHKCLAHLTSPLHAAAGHICSICGKCHDCLGGLCNGKHGMGGDCAGAGCAGPGCGAGHGLFDPNGGSACIVPGCRGGAGCGHQLHGPGGSGIAVAGGGAMGVGTGVVAGAGGAPGVAVVAGKGAPIVASTQATPVAAGSHCGSGVPGCTLAFNHTHAGYGKGGSCGIPGCGVSHTHGGAGLGDPGMGTGCGLCGGKGCNHCLGGGAGAGTGCGLCGGKGCKHCLGLLSHLKLPHLGIPHHPKLTYFVGPGGPVPLTPGYVPYIVATRSPREYFAFPPMNPNDP